MNHLTAHITNSIPEGWETCMGNCIDANDATCAVEIIMEIEGNNIAAITPGLCKECADKILAVCHKVSQGVKMEENKLRVLLYTAFLLDINGWDSANVALVAGEKDKEKISRVCHTINKFKNADEILESVIGELMLIVDGDKKMGKI